MLNRENLMNDDELTNVAGGMGANSGKDTTAENKVKAYCPECKETTTFIVYSGARGKCTKCGHQMTV